MIDKRTIKHPGSKQQKQKPGKEETVCQQMEQNEADIENEDYDEDYGDDFGDL